MTIFTIFSDITTTYTSDKDFSGLLENTPYRTFQAFGSTTSGIGTATIVIDASNDYINWFPIATITLNLGVSVVSDGASSIATWKYVRGRVSSISGTGAKVSLIGAI